VTPHGRNITHNDVPATGRPDTPRPEWTHD
jgi:hypothetical protein